MTHSDQDSRAMLSSVVCGVTRTASFTPFLGSLAEATQVRYRWYKDKLENRQIKRRGFDDRVKQEGALPRLRDDSKAITQMGEYKATNTWAPHRALHGQNDYIDILGQPAYARSSLSFCFISGNDEIHPKNIMYHVPKYLRGIHRKEKYFQMMIKRRDFYEKTPFPKQHPSKWQGWTHLMLHEYRWLNRHMDQNWWVNYKGVKEGPVKNPFKKKVF